MSVGNFKYQALKSDLLHTVRPAKLRNLRADVFDWNHRVHFGPANAPDMLFMNLPKLGSANPFNMTGPNKGEVMRALLANRLWEVQGTGATAAASGNGSVAFAVNGGIVLTTTGSVNDQMILAPLSDGNVMVDGVNAVTYGSPIALTQWYAGRRPWFRTKIKTPATIAGTVIWAGFKLTNTSVVATDNDQAFFRAADGALRCISSNNNTDENSSAGVTLVASTEYELDITVDNNMCPLFYVNGTQVKKGARLRDSQALLPFIGIETTELANPALTVRYVDLSVDLS